MTDTYDSSISFGSRVGSKYIEHKNLQVEEVIYVEKNTNTWISS